MYQQHVGLTHATLGKQTTERWDDGAISTLKERFQWLLDSPGVGLLSGAAVVGKTAALRHLTKDLNPHRYQVIYLAETDFGRLDLYRSLALASRVQTRVQLDPVIERERFCSLTEACLVICGLHTDIVGGLRPGVVAAGHAGSATLCRTHHEGGDANGRAERIKPSAG